MWGARAGGTSRSFVSLRFTQDDNGLRFTQDDNGLRFTQDDNGLRFTQDDGKMARPAAA